MPLDTRKRGKAAGGGGSALLGNHGLGSYARPEPPGHSGGGGGHGDDGLVPAPLDALGLGNFARLDLPAPPDGLDLTAAVKPSSGCIVVSMGGDSITASPSDLAAALSLPLGTVPLVADAEVDEAVFSSMEAIAAVRVFVHDRLLLGGAEDVQMLPEENVAALQLVEDGKAYKVDWGWFVWAFLRSEVLIGKGRRCSQYLLRLMKCKRPELFSEVDGRFLGKRRKGLMLQQEEKLLYGTGGYGQHMAAEAEVGEQGLVFGLGKKIGELEKMPAFGYVKDQQHTIEIEDQEDGNDGKVNFSPSLASFYATLDTVEAQVSIMENAALGRERILTHTLAEIQRMKEKVKDKDNQINYISEETEKESQAMVTKINHLEHEKMVMVDTLHGCKKMFQESLAAFSDYRKMMCEESGVSSLDVVADEKNRVRLMKQQRHAYEIINYEIQKPLLLKFSACAKQIKVLLTKLADLNNEVQRLKDSRSIPHLNVGPHL